jgi:hypothetical protein
MAIYRDLDPVVRWKFAPHAGFPLVNSQRNTSAGQQLLPQERESQHVEPLLFAIISPSPLRWRK